MARRLFMEGLKGTRNVPQVQNLGTRYLLHVGTSVHMTEPSWTAAPYLRRHGTDLRRLQDKTVRALYAGRRDVPFTGKTFPLPGSLDVPFTGKPTLVSFRSVDGRRKPTDALGSVCKRKTVCSNSNSRTVARIVQTVTKTVQNRRKDSPDRHKDSAEPSQGKCLDFSRPKPLSV